MFIALTVQTHEHTRLLFICCCLTNWLCAIKKLSMRVSVLYQMVDSDLHALFLCREPKFPYKALSCNFQI